MTPAKAFNTFFLLTILLALALHWPQHCNAKEHLSHTGKEVTVSFVLDGDTIAITEGERIRYLGIDTPERNEPFFREATEFNRMLLRDKRITIDICKEEPKDKYGRLLAWVYADNILVNLKLIQNGYAKVLSIPPCISSKKARTLKKGQLEAVRKGLGIWADVKTIDSYSASKHVGEYVKVRGTVNQVYNSEKAVFLNFDNSVDKGFYAIIFHDSIEAFKNAGIAAIDLLHKEITITGKINRYSGRPQIILEDPSQVNTDP